MPDQNVPPEMPNPAIETVIIPRVRDIGGFEVRRALPSAGRRMVGPFVFLDQMGPAELITGQGIDVRPHPHIGLATVTYLYQGEILHRDSLGSVQPIVPGDVNWMTAGRGITHSERTRAEVRATGGPLFGIQSWVALPKALEDTAPDFAHVPRAALPVIEAEGKKVRVIAGSLWGSTSPVETAWETIYADAILEAGARLPIPASHEERAIFTLSGLIEIAGDPFGPGQLLVFRPGDEITVTAVEPARILVVGGDPMDGPRHLWWNFVSSDKDRIEEAKAAWKAGAFPAVPDDDEFIPLPE
ncbi:pirin family protein [Chthonobacter albigriseus]|uniref:pirin family protein n=1 Tax=Chthonobacter albigriseus TaxID=1683161 RepID=UPI0015EEAA57|nr:pirin family protein [Chthonobacter albigriseus]